MFALKKTLREPKRGRFYLIFDEIVTHISLKTSKPNPLRKWPKFCTYCMNKNTIVAYVLKDNKKNNKKRIYLYKNGYLFLPFNVAFFKTFIAYRTPASFPFTFFTRNTFPKDPWYQSKNQFRL